jgi:hypothetical protein
MQQLYKVDISVCQRKHLTKMALVAKLEKDRRDKTAQLDKMKPT